ncbi:MAG: hypothetical protein VB858_09700, partial [Planctomycetaceae bacterium]
IREIRGCPVSAVSGLWARPAVVVALSADRRNHRISKKLTHVVADGGTNQSLNHESPAPQTIQVKHSAALALHGSGIIYSR